MSDKVKYKEVAVRLSKLRERTNLRQVDVAQHFELYPEQGYKSVGEWEAGTAKPQSSRRTKFITYLWDRLNLRENPQEFEKVWQTLVNEWGWKPISDAEWLEFFPGVARPGRDLNIVQSAPSESPEQTLPEVAPTTVSPVSIAPPPPLTRWQQTLKWVKWLIPLLLLTIAGFWVLSIIQEETLESGCPIQNHAESNDLAGMLDIDPRGMAVIRGYDLWFTSKIKERWQIWCLDTHSGRVKPVDFKVNGSVLLFDQFVPAISPDGTRIVFAAGKCNEDSFCNRDLYLADLADLNDNTTQRLLTDPNLSAILDEYHPSWSPDGRRLAYHAGNTNHRFGIWVFDLDTRQAHQLTSSNDYDPIWSPSGRYIAYHHLDGEVSNIMVLNYQSCTPSTNHCVTWQATEMNNKATAVSWVNDYKIVFVSGQERARDIYDIPVNPTKTYTNPTQLTHNQWDDEYPAVFGGKILLWQAFQYEDKGNEGAATDKDAVIHVMDLQSREELPLITGIGNARNGFLARQQ